MKKVLVTGGAGFVGSHIVDELLTLGFEVVCIDYVPIEKANNLEFARKQNRFVYYELDITDTNALQALHGYSFYAVFHYASVVGVQKYLDFPQDVINVNILGMQNVLELALKNRAKLVFASTSEVYGKNPNVPWGEEDDRVLGPTHQERWTYSASKSVAEQLLMASYKQTALPWLIVRYFNVYGPRQNANFVVSANLKNKINNRSLVMHNNGQQTRCYTYVTDAVKGTFDLFLNEKVGVYNIGSNIETTVEDLLKEINSLEMPFVDVTSVDTISFGDGFEDIPRRVPNVSKIRKEVNWSAKTSLKAGLEQTKDWIVENPWWMNE